MYNRSILVGNLVRDIEIRYLQSGSAVGNSAIATSHKFKAATGEQKEETMFMDITFFGRTAEIANQYLRKGSRVLIEGRIKQEQWKAQDGSNRSKHVLIVEGLKMLGDNTHGQGGGQEYQGGNSMNHHQDSPQQGTYQAPEANGTAYEPAPQHNPPPEIDINTDEIPF